MEARMRGAVKSSPTPTPHSPLFTHAGIFFRGCEVSSRGGWGRGA